MCFLTERYRAWEHGESYKQDKGDLWIYLSLKYKKLALDTLRELLINKGYMLLRLGDEEIRPRDRLSCTQGRGQYKRAILGRWSFEIGL